MLALALDQTEPLGMVLLYAFDDLPGARPVRCTMAVCGAALMDRAGIVICLAGIAVGLVTLAL
jgi:hypothetical protein